MSAEDESTKAEWDTITTRVIDELRAERDGALAQVEAMRAIVFDPISDYYGEIRVKFDALLAQPSATALAENDDWKDPKPWLYASGKRTAHPLPQTRYIRSPRTREQFEADSATPTEGASE